MSSNDDRTPNTALMKEKELDKDGMIDFNAKIFRLDVAEKLHKIGNNICFFS